MEESRRTSPTPQSPTAQRRLQACERCWKRKQKGILLLPGCTACIEAKAKCCPRSVQLGGTAEDASGLSNAALPDYIETLKRKAEDLDDQSRRRRPRLSTNASDGRPSLPSNIPTDAAHDSPQTSHDTPLTEQTSLTERSVQAAMGEIKFLSRNAMAEPRGEASGFPQELAIGNMIKASLAISGKDPTQSSCSLSQKSKYRNMLGQTPTLTREVVADCMGRFFVHTKALCPYINEGEMLEYRDLSSMVAMDFNVYMATAIGMLLSPESGIELFASSLHNTAMQSFPTILGSKDDFNMLHSMQLLVIYSMFSSMGGSTWHLIGLAMKKAISYRFHKEPLSDIGIPEQKLNRRRDIIWNLYILDRTISCAMDRPFGIKDEDVTLQLPSHGDISLPDALDFPAYVVMHARLLSNMRGSSHQQSIFHYGSFSYWRDIPRGTIGSNIPPTSSRTIRQLTCRSMVCLAQISGFERNATRVFGTTHTIRQDIINTCSEYISNEYLAVEDDCFTGSFVDTFDIFSAGVVLTFLGRMSPSSDVPNAASVLNKCTSLLTLLGERFSALKALCRLLWCLQESADMAQVIELPEIVPHALRVMIEGTFRSSRPVR
ncbi:Zn(II)2Cys6 transcription factor [Aspergillus neoniger CBS 115656]|uniref:Zn(II)2Cys6 transcription factor n=1 Tax=Aspergillus neoniger (strain CBS 115656) TaxID=1448310 RepID=A0A318Y717_ASPNB|nr:Zn(II)2Cys6 transcription factor [Aspergillus neoniger CBS 115656]PYH29337.1 Zn(II)2Cys6 transcription factor [Aspergillus neoniger CBS 115656]